ncbi:hypothetical protein A0H81_06072 [Grifola frondosa]|uniref:Choline/carnitine acyltransferase domain-containing protein n=1 Tax=Grifola frondosa TaxID=5627 RepID=A0A1C7MAG8_GRIFR|nr:hypothetical protein A0H81_06072 [Grifola frondosa]
MRKFQLGRTEVIRSTSKESKAWAEVIRSTSKESKAWAEAMLNPTERVRIAANFERHNCVRSMGGGWPGRGLPLFRLKKLLCDCEPLPEIYKDEAFVKTSHTHEWNDDLGTNSCTVKSVKPNLNISLASFTSYPVQQCLVCTVLMKHAYAEPRPAHLGLLRDAPFLAEVQIAAPFLTQLQPFLDNHSIDFMNMTLALVCLLSPFLPFARRPYFVPQASFRLTQYIIDVNTKMLEPGGMFTPGSVNKSCAQGTTYH